MRRRTAVLLLACAGLFATGSLFVTGSAGAQTSTTSSSTSSTTSSSTSTSTTSATSTSTSTTIADPCTRQVCTVEPPTAFLAGGNGEVRLDQDGSCWRSPTRNAQGGFTARCADTAPHDPTVRLVVQVGETLTLRFDAAMTPTEVALQVGDRTTPLVAGNPVRFRVDLAVGVTDVHFFTRWFQGDATYGVRLDVRPAATTPPATPVTGGGLSLTG